MAFHITSGENYYSQIKRHKGKQPRDGIVGSLYSQEVRSNSVCCQ